MEIGFGWGATGQTSHIVLNHNRITGAQSKLKDDGTCCLVGGGGNAMLVNNYAVSGNTIRINSSENIFDRNTSNAVLLIAGLSFGGGPANDNTIEWTSVDDQIWRNGWGDANDCTSANPTNCGGGGGGILLIGAIEFTADGSPSTSHGNRINVNLTGTNFVHPHQLKGPGNLANDPRTGMNGFHSDLASAPDVTGFPTSQDDNVITVSARGVTANDSTFVNPDDGHRSSFIFDDLTNGATPNSFTAVKPKTQQQFERMNNNLAWPACEWSFPDLGAFCLFNPGNTSY